MSIVSNVQTIYLVYCLEDTNVSNIIKDIHVTKISANQTARIFFYEKFAKTLTVIIQSQPVMNMLSRTSLRCYSSASSGLKVSAKESSGNLTNLSVVVNNAGSKAGKSGLAHLLSKYNFLNTEAKSALRFTRESELLGGIVSSYVTRDSIILNTQFLKEDLPYYVEALGNVIANTSYRPHELPETVIPAALAECQQAHGSNQFTALESLHEITFRKGYGLPLYYDGAYSYSSEDVANFASQVYNAANVSIVASGAVEADLQQFVNDSAFSSLASGSSAATVPVKSFTGKEARIRASGKSLAVIGIPIKPSEFSTYDILSATIGNVNLPAFNTPLSSIPGATSKVHKYSDAGLFTVSVTGDAEQVSSGISKAKAAMSSVSAKDLSNSVKSAQLATALESSLETPLDYAIEGSAAKAFKLGAFNYVAVGDVDVLPFADEL